MNEDLPEEWNDRRRILTKDKLVIDGKTYSAGPNPNIMEANKVLDVPGSCQKADEDKIIFLGCHSIFSNFHSSPFVLDSTHYNCVEQWIQSQKAALFNDDLSHSKIMCEHNPYKIKKLGSKIRNFNQSKWDRSSKEIAYIAVRTKFMQNPPLRNILLSTGDSKIAESSVDSTWGTELHLRDTNAMDMQFWKNDGGAMCEIYSKLRHEL